MQALAILALAAAAVGLAGLAEASELPQGDNLKKIVASTPRPSVLLNQAELEALRNAVGVPGPQHDAYLRPLKSGDSDYAGESIRAVADKWLKAAVKIPGYGGHGHHFFCDCGTMLTLPPDMEPRPKYKCPACGKTFSGERYDAAVRVLQHHNLANAALYLALVYALENKREYSDKAADILRQYARVYPGPHTNATSGGMLFQSLNEAMWIIPLAQAYDLVFDSPSLSKADKRLIEERLFTPAAKGIMRCGVGGNWGSWHLSAVGVVGFAIRDADLVGFALAHFGRQMASDLGDDGLWPESVHCYHFFPLQAFVYLAEAARGSGIDLYGYEPKPGKGLKAMFTAPLQYIYPSFRLPAVNDGWYDAWLPLNLYEAAYKRWPEPSFAWVLDKGYEKQSLRTVDAGLGYLGGPALCRFLFGRKPSENAAAPNLRSTNYPNFGLCTLRNDIAMLTFHYGRFLGHGHLDKLSFTLYANDELLVPDYGTPGYGSRILGWYQSTPGHNTVVVDGKSQARSAQAAIDVFQVGEVAQYAEASTSDCYPGVTHTRRILLIGKTCLVIDDLKSNEQHDYDWLLRCEGRPKVTGSYVKQKIAAETYPHAAFERVDRFADVYRLDWRTRNSALALAMWTDKEGGLAGLGACPAETDSRHVSFFMCRTHGRTARFIAALAVSESGETPAITRDGNIITSVSSDGALFISGRQLAGASSSGDLATDGDIAAVQVRDGKAVGAVLVHGTWLEWKGKRLIECPPEVDCAEAKL